MTTNTRWELDEESLVRELPLAADERRLARARASDLLEAIAQLQADSVRAAAPAAGQTLAAGAPLYIPSLKLHVNLTAAARGALLSSIGILVKAMLLTEKGFIDLAEPLTTNVIKSLLEQFTRLTDEQRQALDAICALKRKNPLPAYRPSTRDIAGALGRKPAAVEKTLKPISGQVVRYDAKSKGWALVL